MKADNEPRRMLTWVSVQFRAAKVRKDPLRIKGVVIDQVFALSVRENEPLSIDLRTLRRQTPVCEQPNWVVPFRPCAKRRVDLGNIRIIKSSGRDRAARRSDCGVNARHDNGRRTRPLE